MTSRRSTRRAPGLRESAPAPATPTASNAVAMPMVEGDPLRWMWLALVSGLYFIRWWKPTEGALLGDTLDIASGWFLAFALAGWLGLRGTIWSIKWDALQWAVILLVGGHVLSGLMILATSGDRRAAVNLMWEWASLGIAFPMLRCALSGRDSRREWAIVALAAVVTLSGYGLTQRHLFYPQMIAQYEKVRGELDLLEQVDESDNSSRLPRIQKLRAELLGSGLSHDMLTGSGRHMFEGRLKHSSEALGRFALANSFAGLLLVGWILLFVIAIQYWRMGGVSTDAAQVHQILWLHRFVLVASTLLVGYCLLLTKSRTAFVGGLAGVVVWSLAGQWQWSISRRRLVLGGIGASVAVGGLVLLAGLTGGLDRLVLAEAPKSLQYRLEYWWSSLGVIRESALLGVGPGQFRQHYLAHKLPSSSEEIADPHNLVLDVWANGGVLALAGLAGVVFVLVREVSRFVRQRVPGPMTDADVFAQIHATPMTTDKLVQPTIPLSSTVRESGQVPNPAQKIPRPKTLERNGSMEHEISTITFEGWASPWRWGALGGLLILWLLGGGLESLLLGLLVSWFALIWVFDRVLPIVPVHSLCWSAIGIGLLIHLCGAGGIAMPAVSQLLLLGVILSLEVNQEEDAHHSSWMNWLIMLGGLGLFLGCYFTAVQPVVIARTLLDQGDVAKLHSQRVRLYQQATLADHLAAEPWDRLAESYFQKWRDAEPDERDFRLAVEAQRHAIDRNPFSFHTHRTLGLFYAEAVRQTGKPEDKLRAVQEMQAALARYPQHAGLLADAAETFEIAGQNELASQTARRAIEQDDINHQAGHSDKWLTDLVRLRMVKLSDTTN